MRVPAWLLGTGVPAALRLRARLLQPRHRPLQLPARLPGQELPGALSGREIRISVRAQVMWESRGDPAGLQSHPGGCQCACVCPFGWAGRPVLGLSITGWMKCQCCPKRNSSLMPVGSFTLKSGCPLSHSPW